MRGSSDRGSSHGRDDGYMNRSDKDRLRKIDAKEARRKKSKERAKGGNGQTIKITGSTLKISKEISK